MLLATILVLASPALPPTGIAAIRAVAAKEIGGGTGAWELKGTAFIHNVKEPFEMKFDSDGRFLMADGLPLPDSQGYDGKTVWYDGPSGVPHTLVLQDKDVYRVMAWVTDGEWASRRAELSFTQDQDGKVGASPTGGVLTARIEFDAAHSLPAKLSYWTSSGDESWMFENYRRFGGRLVPTHLIHHVGSQDQTIDFSEGRRIPAASDDFAMPPADQSNSSFDPRAGDQIEVKHIGGYMFVHPLVNDQDVGWFFLDTGADVMCIDLAVAKKLGLPALGRDVAAGSVAVADYSICRGDSFQLGPITLEKPTLFEFDLSGISKAFKLPLGGICGYDFISRADLVINPKGTTITVLKPGAATVPAGTHWTSLDFDGNTPCIQCDFEGGRGDFNFDTGSGETVDFFSPAVKRLHLLDQKGVSSGVTGGAGGIAASKSGNIAWFELAGHRIDSPHVGLQITDKGTFASPYLTGNVGMGFIAKYTLVLDYKNKRLALL